MRPQLTKDDIEYLRQYYYDWNNPAAYGGPRKVYNALKGTFTYGQIKQFLQNEDAYSLQKPVRHKFVRQKVVVTHIDEEFEADLMVVQNLSKYNDKIQYLLVVIDIFSRYLWIEPLLDKRSKSIIEAFKTIFAGGRIPEKLRSDAGSEFVNRWVKDYLKSKNIYFFTTRNTETKASFVERVIRSFRDKMFRFLTKNHTYRYIDHLQELVHSYNLTPHRSLHNLSPSQVNDGNEADLWAFQYLTTKKMIKDVKRRYIRYKFKVGDTVRLTHIKHPFRRSYQEQWTTELFKVNQRFQLQGIPMYKVKDFQDKPIEGTFYQSELQKVEKNEDELWKISKILKKRKRGGKTEYLVQFEGWPKQYNQYVPEEDIKNID